MAYVFSLFSVRSLNDLVWSGLWSQAYIWCPPPLEFSCRVIVWYCMKPAPECFQRIVRNQREHMVTVGGSSLWRTCPAWCFAIQGTMHFKFQLPLSYSITWTTWWHTGTNVPSLYVQMKLDGCLFLVVWGESLYRMKEHGLHGFLASEKGSWTLGRWKCRFLGLCQQAWHRGAEWLHMG